MPAPAARLTQLGKKPHAPPLQVSEHVVVACHWPSIPHVWTPVPEHCVVFGVHTPVHAPPTQAWFEHVATGVSDTRSGPHCTAVVGPEHTVSPGRAFMHVGSMAAHVPCAAETRLSQFSPDGQVERSVHRPPLQKRVCFWALPLHAS